MSNNVNKNTIFNTIKSICSIIYPLVTFPYISRILLTDNVGKVNFGNSIVSYFALISSLGVSTYAIRECSKYKSDQENLDKTASQIISINMFSTIIAYLALAITLFSVSKLDNYRVLICIQSSTILFTTLGADWINSAMEDFKFIAIRTMGMQLVSLILMFVFVRQQEDYLIYALISVIASSGANIINIFYRRKFCRIKLTLKIDFKKHLPPIIKLFAMLLAQQIFTNSDITIIGLVLGDHAVGLYSTALKIYTIVTQVTASITWVVMPQLSIAFLKHDILSIKKYFKYALNFILVLGVPCTVGMFMLNEEIVQVVGGFAYIGAAGVLRILSFTLVSTFFSNFFLNIYMLSAGRDTVSLMACTVAAVFNCIANIIFIPMFGINAAAYTTLISQILMVLICIPYRDKSINIMSLLDFAWQPILAAVGMVLTIVLIKVCLDNYILRVIISIVLGGFIYSVLLILIKNEFVTGFLGKIIKR